MERLRVLLICPRDTLFRDWYGLVFALMARKCEVVPVVPRYAYNYASGAYDALYKLRPLPVSTLGVGNYIGHAALDVWHEGQLRQLIRLFDPAVIHVMGEASYVVTAQLARLVGQGPLLTCRAAQNVYQEWPFPLSACEAGALDRLDAIFYLSVDARKVLIRKGYNGRLIYLPNGYDSHVFNGACKTLDATQPVKIGYVGQLLRRKGPDVLLHALAMLKDLAWTAVFVGDGPMRDELKSMAQNLDVADRVLFLGKVEREGLPTIYRDVHLLVVPSRSSTGGDYRLGRWLPFLRVKWKEQFGRVIVEAMACGCPVVGSSSGAIPEVIGDAGWIFEENSPESLASVLRRVLTDAKGEITKKSEAALHRSRLFSWESVAETLLSTWESMLQ